MRARLQAAALVLLLSAHTASAAPPPAGAPVPGTSRAASSAAPSQASEPLPVSSAVPSGSPASVTSAPTDPLSRPATEASAAPAKAASSGPVAPAPSEDGPRALVGGEEIDWGRQITSTIVWLVLMCATIWILMRVVYGRMGLGALGRGGRPTIQVLDRHMLGPQKALLTVKVPGKVLLLGMTEQTITTLAELSSDDVEGARSGTPAAPAMSRSGSDVSAGSELPPSNLVDLASLFGRRTPQPTKGDEIE